MEYKIVWTEKHLESSKGIVKNSINAIGQLLPKAGDYFYVACLTKMGKHAMLQGYKQIERRADGIYYSRLLMDF